MCGVSLPETLRALGRFVIPKLARRHPRFFRKPYLVRELAEAASAPWPDEAAAAGSGGGARPLGTAVPARPPYPAASWRKSAMSAKSACTEASRARRLSRTARSSAMTSTPSKKRSTAGRSSAMRPRAPR